LFQGSGWAVYFAWRCDYRGGGFAMIDLKEFKKGMHVVWLQNKDNDFGYVHKIISGVNPWVKGKPTVRLERVAKDVYTSELRLATREEIEKGHSL
jgi:hypothetical protein